MSLLDCRGVPVSTTNRASLARYEHAAELLAGYFVDPLAAIDEALAEDPDLVIGHCFKAALAVMSTERGALPMLAESLAALDRLLPRANDRERAHGAAARAWLAGDFAASVRRYGDILLDHPRDLLALQVAHVGDFLLGASQMLRDRPAQVAAQWDPGTPGRGYLLGMYAFGLEEMGHHARAEDLGHQALALNPRDVWAVHAVTHVLEMQGRVREGQEWLNRRSGDWSPGNAFAYHNWWHLALFHLDLGEHGRALELYNRSIHPRPSLVALENVDASALLWRLHLRGVDVSARWQELADGWQAQAEDAFYAFNDVHAVMAFAGAGRLGLAEQTLAAMQRRLSVGGTNQMMTREVGLPLARALLAFVRGQHDQCIEDLLAVRTIAHRFGGSHAQRDVIHLTLVEAALRAGRGPLARALSAERTEYKPTSPFNWLLTARALELTGQVAPARHARQNVDLRRRVQSEAQVDQLNGVRS